MQALKLYWISMFFFLVFLLMYIRDWYCWNDTELHCDDPNYEANMVAMVIFMTVCLLVAYACLGVMILFILGVLV